MFKNLCYRVFRLRRIPDPIAKLVNGKTDGVVKASEMHVMNGLMAVLENFDFDLRCKIDGFILEHVPDGEGKPIQLENKGGRFEGAVSDAIRAAKAGDQYYFSDVQARCPGDSHTRQLNELAFYIR